MKHDFVHNCPLVFCLIFFLVFGFSGCSKTSESNKSESKAGTSEQAPAKAIGMEELKQIYLVFIDEFKLKPFGLEDEERYASNQREASKAINELESLSDNIREPRTKEIFNKFLGLLKEYNEAAPILENTIRETKSSKEDLKRREEEIKEKEKTERDPFKYFNEKAEIQKKRSELADYGNIGVKKSKVESIETALYWLHKDFGIEGLKK